MAKNGQSSHDLLALVSLCVAMRSNGDMSNEREKLRSAADATLSWYIVIVEYAIVLGLLLVASVVLVRTVVDFLRNWGGASQSVVSAIDGILVVIILIDIAHTVFGHVKTSIFPVRPFLVIGILAGVRDILSASARLTYGSSLTHSGFNDTLISLGVGVGVVVFLLVGLLILHYTRYNEDNVHE
ncbi:MAG TPA: phosphate-starvation-inducible PsiE family protein [Acidimicrobiales bacterium]